MSKKIAEIWKDVPGYDNLQASSKGNIRLAYKDGTYRVLCKWANGGTNRPKNQYKVRYSLGHRKSKDLIVARLVYEAFKGTIPDDYSVVHKNGLHTDNAPENLILCSRRELGKIHGFKGRRKPVSKLEKTGEVIEFFPSATAAARKGFMNLQTIINHCNDQKVAPDGYYYRWET
ncbi:MAG: HNH endonuclease [Butyrivibrio sp.]|uniref:HNH endonuclease n=1 Tax=Butyrivibrio sp. TaxID=28121 RepID=UPI001B69BDE0|nr:HNH endonuclease [Butyrivibrio sp.]MBP3783865.1 HNH endonuclease [Butyrivibrio sp.]